MQHLGVAPQDRGYKNTPNVNIVKEPLGLKHQL